MLLPRLDLRRSTYSTTLMIEAALRSGILSAWDSTAVATGYLDPEFEQDDGALLPALWFCSLSENDGRYPLAPGFTWVDYSTIAVVQSVALVVFQPLSRVNTVSRPRRCPIPRSGKSS